jgi:hypothetical protein
MVDDRTIINYMAFSMAYENQEETSTKVVTLTTNKASGNAWMNVSLDATYVINKQRTPFGDGGLCFIRIKNTAIQNAYGRKTSGLYQRSKE